MRRSSRSDLKAAGSFQEVIERIAARAATLPAGTWVTGRGWDQTLWDGAAFPHHDALSRRVPDHPVLVSRVDGHAALANEAALALAGLDGVLDPVPEIEGGQVVVGDDGRATGVLIDTAMGLVSVNVPEPTDADVERHILAAQDALLAKGLTCVHDMGIDRSTVEVYRRLAARGDLQLRVAAYVWGNDLETPGDLDGYPVAPDARDRFTVVGVKLMADGALGSRGAAMIEDYTDAPGERGLLRFENAAEFAELLGWVFDSGLQPATHAIGDRANRFVLDAYQAALEAKPARAGLRPRVEHAQILHPDDVKRFTELEVVPSMQPTHCTSDMRWAAERVGPERVRGAYAWRDIDLPGVMAFGSDFPVEDPDPLEGLYAAITRQDAEGHPRDGFFPMQRLGLRRALEAFTSGAARACHQEGRRGKLEPGYGCDMTVLDRDPTSVGPTAARMLLETEVVMTVVHGEVVYRKER